MCDAGQPVSLNLWSTEGQQFFNFSQLPSSDLEPQHRHWQSNNQHKPLKYKSPCRCHCDLKRLEQLQAQGAGDQVQGAGDQVQGAAQLRQGAGHPAQGVRQKAHDARQLAQTARHLTQGTGHLAVQQAGHPVQGARHPAQRAGQPVQGVTPPAQGVGPSAQEFGPPRWHRNLTIDTESRITSARSQTSGAKSQSIFCQPPSPNLTG